GQPEAMDERRGTQAAEGPLPSERAIQLVSEQQGPTDPVASGKPDDSSPGRLQLTL
ncbi:hypothetical protein KUCAC02_006194, partial [Chaenocephalus aceratus]